MLVSKSKFRIIVVERITTSIIVSLSDIITVLMANRYFIDRITRAARRGGYVRPIDDILIQTQLLQV
jgi:hypothetical protein